MQNVNLKKYGAGSEAALAAASWLDNEAGALKDLEAKKDRLKTQSYRIKKRAEAAGEVLEASTTLGVFGASQAGKSYLVSRMAAGESGELATVWDGQSIDFLTHVNPQGQDKEATGFVTRFTHRPNPGIPGFPIKVRVFREIEIAMILVNSFFNDLDQDDIVMELDDKALDEHLKACEALISKEEANYVTPEDVVELADYARSRSGGKLQRLDADHPFWLKARDLAPKLSLKGRSQLFSFLWQDLKVFTLLYERLAADLVKLEGRSFVFAPLEAFVEKVDGTLMQRKRGTIINISSLAHLFHETQDIALSLDESGEHTAVLPFASFAAVSLEITFPLAGSCPISNFDVLDFPGARERRRDKIGDFRNDEKGFDGQRPTNYMIEQGTEFIRRGKVAYLFDRYSKRQEIDVLLFCIGVNAQQEVSSIVSILNGWIDINAGATPALRQAYEERYGRCPLICVLTRFDSVFERQIANIEAKRPTNTQREMQDAIEKISAQGWMKEWLPGKPFDNFFIARRPNLPNIGRWMTMENGRESGVNPEYREMVEAIKDELRADPLFVRHIKDAERALESILSEDGGVNLITELLASNYQETPVQREAHCSAALRAETSRFVDELEQYAKPEGEEALKEYREKALKIACDLLQCHVVARIMGKLRGFMEVKIPDLEKAYLENFSAGSNALRFAQKSLELYLSNLADLARGAKLEFLTQQLLAAWNEQKINLAYDKKASAALTFFCSEGHFKSDEEIASSFANLLGKFSRETASLARSSRLDLKSRLQKLLKDDESVNNQQESSVKGQVRIASLFLSDFNSSFDLYELMNKSSFKPARCFAPSDPNEDPQGYCFKVLDGNAPEDEALLRVKAGDDPLFDVPLLGEQTRGYEFSFISGYLSAFVYAVVQANAQESIKGGAEDGLSIEANRSLCGILETLKESL